LRRGWRSGDLGRLGPSLLCLLLRARCFLPSCLYFPVAPHKLALHLGKLILELAYLLFDRTDLCVGITR
jgi:hypothetical protein